METDFCCIKNSHDSVLGLLH